MTGLVVPTRAGTSVAAAVTALFVPGDRPERFAKAAASGADVVIIDLEDAVAPDAKDRARRCAAQALAPTADAPVRALVRVNGADTDTFDADVDALLDVASVAGSGLLGVVLPKAENPGVVAALVARLHATDADMALVALVESAVGVLNAAAIAATPGVTRLALGAIDLTGDVDADLDSPIVAHAMVQLVLASRAARITAPLDSPATAIKDRAAVELSARVARATGFGGKLCIHPAQLDPVRTAFRPTQDQISWARRVVDQISTAGEAAVQLDGQMIDKPVIDKARRILCRAGQDAS